MNASAGTLQKQNNHGLSFGQIVFLVLLRTAVGWHFLYEGLAKLIDPKWSAAPYLADSRWILSSLFHWMASTPAVLKAVDLLNIWGLIAIGAGLMAGLMVRAASLAGILLILLYWAANPPLAALGSAGFPEGNYLIVDKNLVECFALCVLFVFPSGRWAGLDPLVRHARQRLSIRKSTKTEIPESGPGPEPASLARRELLSGFATVPFAGAFALAWIRKRSWESEEEKWLASKAKEDIQAVTSATMKTFRFTTLKELKAKPPCGRIGNLTVSRLILGGNLIGGWAHSRDLVYVSKLVKSYHTDRRVFDTLRLAEACGVNTLLTNPQLSRVIRAYWRREGGAIQFISDCGLRGDAMAGVNLSVDAGAHACYVQGEISDRLVRENNLEPLEKALALIRKNGLPAGIGAHALETVRACVKNGIEPDFWVKTLHHTRYWSAQAKTEKDNIWCKNPEETVAFMDRLEKPWIAFKVLAAGAILPKDGFRYAFENGADFICVGMYDFQIVEDVNTASGILGGPLDRKRSWFA